MATNQKPRMQFSLNVRNIVRNNVQVNEVDDDIFNGLTTIDKIE